MKCNMCGSYMEIVQNDDEEIVCEKCGAAYILQYLGYYKDDETRIDAGFEDYDYLNFVGKLKEYNASKNCMNCDGTGYIGE